MAPRKDDPLSGLRALASQVQARGRELMEAAGRTLSGDPPPPLRGPILAQAPPWPGPPTPPSPYFIRPPLDGYYDLNGRNPAVHQGDGRFGTPRVNTRGEVKTHAGQDITAPVGTPVRSAEPGRVIRADGKNLGGYGNQIVVQHPDGRQTRYGHLSRFDAKVGDVVQQGEQIGLTGVSGNTPDRGQPHLHFEVMDHGRVQDPDAYYDRTRRGLPMSPRIANRLYGDG